MPVPAARHVARLILLSLGLNEIGAFSSQMASLCRHAVPGIHARRPGRASMVSPCMQLKASGTSVAATIQESGRTTNALMKQAGRSVVQKFDEAGSFVPDPSKTDARIALLVVAALSGSGYGAVKLLDGSLDSPSILAIRFVIAAVVLAPWVRKCDKKLLPLALETGAWLSIGYIAQVPSVSRSFSLGVRCLPNRRRWRALTFMALLCAGHLPPNLKRRRRSLPRFADHRRLPLD